MLLYNSFIGSSTYFSICRRTNEGAVFFDSGIELVHLSN